MHDSDRLRCRLGLNLAALAVSTSGGLPAAGVTQDATFNVTPATMAPLRLAIAQASIKLVPITIIGDSLSAGYEATGPETPAQAWPGVLRAYVNASGGYSDGGSYVCSADALHWPQWSYDANWTFSATVFVSTAAGVATYVSTDVGQNTIIWYHNQSAPFSYTVDGGAVHNVVPTGTATVKSVVLTGLANAVHTIAITASAAGVYLVAAGVFQATGLLWNNFAQTSSGALQGYAAIAGAVGGWSQFANGDLGFYRCLIIQQLIGGAYGTPIIGICLGSNDICAGGFTPAQVIAGYNTMLTGLPAAAMFGVIQFRQPDVTDATWNAWVTALQAWAVSKGIPLFDWNARLGGYSAMLAAGLLQSDATHPGPGANLNIGQAIGDFIFT
jgi:lysophospholipase L1-like esterase